MIEATARRRAGSGIPGLARRLAPVLVVGPLTRLAMTIPHRGAGLLGFAACVVALVFALRRLFEGRERRGAVWLAVATVLAVLPWLFPSSLGLPAGHVLGSASILRFVMLGSWATAVYLAVLRRRDRRLLAVPLVLAVLWPITRPVVVTSDARLAAARLGAPEGWFLDVSMAGYQPDSYARSMGVLELDYGAAQSGWNDSASFYLRVSRSVTDFCRDGAGSVCQADHGYWRWKDESGIGVVEVYDGRAVELESDDQGVSYADLLKALGTVHAASDEFVIQHT